MHANPGMEHYSNIICMHVKIMKCNMLSLFAFEDKIRPSFMPRSQHHIRHLKLQPANANLDPKKGFG